MQRIQVPPLGLIYILLFLSTLPAYSQSSRDANLRGPKTWGIFIGVDQTAEGVGTGNASKYATDFHDLWVQNQGVDPGFSFLLLNENAQRTAFREALYALRTAHPQDRVTIYISTPTLVEFSDSLTASGHLIPFDGLLNPRPDSSSRLIPALELQDAVLTSPASEVLVFIDAPMSGLHAPAWPPISDIPDIPLPLESLGKHLLVAGRWGDTFSQTQEGQSPFVASITTALKTLHADTNGDRLLSFTELGQYVRSRVRDYTNGNQFVQIRSYGGSRDIAMGLGTASNNVPAPPDTTVSYQSTDSLIIAFNSTPLSAQVYIDNQYMGTTPLRVRVSQWQDYAVLIHQNGYLPWEEIMTPDRASTPEKDIQLFEDKAILNFANIPRDHEVWVNGSREEMADIEPLELTTGAYHVLIKKGSKDVVDRQLMLNPETSNQLSFERRFNVSPIMASFFFPGLGQFTHGARGKGIGFAAATFSALAVSMIHNAEYQDNKDLFFETQGAYERARTPAQASILRDEMLGHYDAVIEYNDKRRNMLFVAIAVQGLGVLDALIFHSRKSVLDYETKKGLTPFLSARHDGMSMGLRIGL